MKRSRAACRDAARTIGGTGQGAMMLLRRMTGWGLAATAVVVAVHTVGEVVWQCSLSG